MKTKERHHLKENALAHQIGAAREFVETRQRQVTAGIIVVAVVAVAVIGVVLFRNRTDDRGQALLGEAMVALNAPVVPVTAAGAQPGDLPAAAALGATGSFQTEDAKLAAALPKLKAAAEAYPDSEAGVTARYHYAATLATMGRHAEAIQAFDEVVSRAGDGSLYGRMAALGKADTQSKSGAVDAAIAAWKDMAARKDANLPEDAILMELARAYQAKGNVDDARKTYTQLVDDFPTSPYAAEARAELDSLKS